VVTQKESKRNGLEELLVKLHITKDSKEALQKMGRVEEFLGKPFPPHPLDALKVFLENNYFLGNNEPDPFSKGASATPKQQEYEPPVLHLSPSVALKDRVFCTNNEQEYKACLAYLQSKIRLDTEKVFLPQEEEDRRTSPRRVDLKYVVCIPTVITKEEEEGRRSTLRWNIQNYLNMGASKIVLFFRETEEKTREYLRSNFSYAYPLYFVTYEHRGKSHVGWARRAIALYLMASVERSPKQNVMIADDRRMLKIADMYGEHNAAQGKNLLKDALKKAQSETCFLSFFKNSMMSHASIRQDFIDTKFVTQIYLGTVQNFKDFYTCAFRSNVLEACFARLLEDYAFNQLAYHFSFDLLVYTRLQITTRKVPSIARRHLTSQQISELFRQGAQQSLLKAIQIVTQKRPDGKYMITFGKNYSIVGPKDSYWENTINIIKATQQVKKRLLS